MDDRELLRTVPIFSDLDEPALSALARLTTHRRFPKDAVIFFENSQGDTLFVIVEGRVRVTILGDDGREIILSLMGPGDFFGELALLDNEPRSATTIAAGEVELLCLSRPDFEAVVREHESITKALLTEVAARLRHANHQISTLALLDVYGRVARVLLEIARQEGKRLKDGHISFRRPTHQEIASRIGTTRETVTRMLRDLQRQGLVHVEGREMTVGPDFEKQFD